MEKSNFNIQIHNRFTVISSQPMIQHPYALPQYSFGEAIYVASFIRRKDLYRPGVLHDEIENIKANALHYAEPSFDDAITSALVTEIRLPSIVKHPDEWMAIVATIEYHPTESTEQIVAFNEIRSIDNRYDLFNAIIIGMEITPLTQISTGIDPHRRGMYLRSVKFDSKNI